MLRLHPALGLSAPGRGSREAGFRLGALAEAVLSRER